MFHRIKLGGESNLVRYLGYVFRSAGLKVTYLYCNLAGFLSRLLIKVPLDPSLHHHQTNHSSPLFQHRLNTYNIPLSTYAIRPTKEKTRTGSHLLRSNGHPQVQFQVPHHPPNP